MSMDEAQNAFMKAVMEYYLSSTQFKTSLKDFINRQATVESEGMQALMKFRCTLEDYEKAKQLLAKCSVVEVREDMLEVDSLNDKIKILLEHLDEENNIATGKGSKE